MMQCLQLTRGDAPKKEVTVTLAGTFNSTYAYVEIDGTKYNAVKTLAVKTGTMVTVTVSTNTSSTGSRRNTKITLNGETVASGTDQIGNAAYSFIITSKCRIAGSYQGSSSANTIAITMPY